MFDRFDNMRIKIQHYVDLFLLFLFQHEEESLGMERQLTDLVISSLESLSLERRMVQFWARLLSITEMILCRRPIVPISRRSSIEPSTL